MRLRKTRTRNNTRRRRGRRKTRRKIKTRRRNYQFRKKRISKNKRKRKRKSKSKNKNKSKRRIKRTQKKLKSFKGGSIQKLPLLGDAYSKMSTNLTNVKNTFLTNHTITGDLPGAQGQPNYILNPEFKL